MKNRFTVDWVQIAGTLLGGILGTIAGVLVGIVVGAYLLMNYEIGGSLGAAVGVWFGSFLGLSLVAKLSQETGSGSLSLIVGGVGALLFLIGMIQVVPDFGTIWMVFVIPMLVYVGWSIPHWRAASASSPTQSVTKPKPQK